MNYTTFTKQIYSLKKERLGGQTSQFKLAPKTRIDFNDSTIANLNPKKAAVLALFYPDKNNQTRFLLIERASYNGKHSNQISFVGGKPEKDETLKETALRETFEEVGINNNQVNIIRMLSDTYIPPSNFLVTPFLGFSETPLTFAPNYEVNSIIEVLATDLLDNKNLKTKIIETSYMQKTLTPYFSLNNKIVWGATAMILSEIKDLLKKVF